MLRIGIDTFSFDRPGENLGVGRGVYAYQLLEHLFRVGSNHRFFVFTHTENRTFVPKGQNVDVLTIRLPNRPRLFRPIHEQLIVPYYAKKLRLDGVHFFGNNISHLIADRSILTVYDLMWKYYLSRGARSMKYLYFALTVPPSIRRAHALIAISAFVSSEIQNEFGITEKRITTIPLGPGRLEEPDSSTMSSLQSEFDYPFIFSVTTSFPHKNLATLVSAYCGLRKRGVYNGKLVIAGQLKGPYSETIRQTILSTGATEDIRLLGFVSEPMKTFLYRSADLVVFPSLYEGFGLPILEAMQCGIPVICAQAASLPEVGGDACVYFDPFSVEDLGAKMESVLRDPTAQKTLAQLGQKRVSLFSWELAARSTIEVYERVFA